MLIVNEWMAGTLDNDYYGHCLFFLFFISRDSVTISIDPSLTGNFVVVSQ